MQSRPWRFELPLSRGLTWQVGRLGPGLVRFELRPERRAHFAGRRRWGALRADLDDAWRSYRLRGAALIYERIPLPRDWWKCWPVARPNSPVLYASGEILILNVLSRACGGLLLPSTPPSYTPDWLGRTLWSDDARLVALARASGVSEVEY